MPIVKVDKKGRITLPSRLARQMRIRHGDSLILKPRQDALVIHRVGPSSEASIESDPLIWNLRHPLKLRSKVKNLKKELEKIEDEMWLP